MEEEIRKASGDGIGANELAPSDTTRSESGAIDDRAIVHPAEACMICERQQVEGLRIVEEFICVDCERELVQTEVSDAKYPFFIHRMKQMWQRKNA